MFIRALVPTRNSIKISLSSQRVNIRIQDTFSVQIFMILVCSILVANYKQLNLLASFLYLFCSTPTPFIGLIKLPDGVKFSGNVRPAKLPTDCQSATDEDVIVAGAGIDRIHRTYSNPPVLRYAYSHTISCASSCIGDDLDHNTLICAQVVDSQSAYSGDSGGPLIREEDGTLIGVLSFVVENDGIYDFDNHIHYQVSTNIRYYFDWIAEVTGLEMPKC